jgi:hypothetical protein
MSAQLISAGNFPNPKKLAVSFRLLLSLYSIIPICLALQLIDNEFWQGYLKTRLPSSPTHFILFQILFGTPHIIASAIVLASNSDYVKFYKRKLLWMSAAIICFFGLGSLFIPYRVLYILVACWIAFLGIQPFVVDQHCSGHSHLSGHFFEKQPRPATGR